jgi:hypothetical protein
MPSITPRLRAMLRLRSEGICEVQLPGCHGRATDNCHRLGKKAGGRPRRDLDRLANLYHGCRHCHGWTHDNPLEAQAMGLVLREYQKPEDEPMLRRGVRVLLDDDGYVTPADGGYSDTPPDGVA